jgi:hypothetical protein
MYCPKCGTENLDDGKFCRKCGTDLAVVSAALSGKSLKLPYTVDPRKRGVSWEFAITKTFTGLAFLAVSIILGFTGNFGAANWWFWLLIPAFGSLSSGVAQVFQLKKLEKLEAGFLPQNSISSSLHNNVLSPVSTDYSIPPKQSIYDTDDLIIQPSVTENTTKLLKIEESK